MNPPTERSDRLTVKNKLTLTRVRRAPKKPLKKQRRSTRQCEMNIWSKYNRQSTVFGSERRLSWLICVPILSNRGKTVKNEKCWQNTKAQRCWTCRNRKGVANCLCARKNGSLQFCVDCHKLITATNWNSYSIPQMNKCSDILGTREVFHTVDASSGYWQIKLDKTDMK